MHGYKGYSTLGERRGFALSPLLQGDDWQHLARQREASRELGVEGLMLKRRESAYLAGRPKGHWYKWKRDALLLDCVVMYAQRGHGRRSSYYSDYTFGLWRPAEEGGGEELVSVGKAYFGFTDEELARRHAAHEPSAPEHQTPWQEIYRSMVGQLSTGACLEPATAYRAVGRKTPRNSH